MWSGVGKVLYWLIVYSFVDMRARALLALVVLLMSWGAQPGASVSQRAPPLTPTGLFLEANASSPHNLTPLVPVSEGYVDIYKSEAAEFVAREFYGLLVQSEGFGLDLVFISLNISGVTVAFELFLDLTGDGTDDAMVHFENYTSEQPIVPERVQRGAQELPGDLSDIKGGSIRLRIIRTDELDGWLRVCCGRMTNSSTLWVPYSRPLVADAGQNLLVSVNRTTILNGSASLSIAPEETTYEWELEAPDGCMTKLSGRVVEALFNCPGIHNVTLRIRWKYFEDSDRILVTVLPNQPPSGIIYHPLIVNIQTPVNFTCECSDPDGEIVLYLWDFGDGNRAEGVNVTHSYSSHGYYYIILNITDDNGATTTIKSLLKVNHPPVISGIIIEVRGREVSFRACATDPDDNLLTYNWDFGDGATAEGFELTHRYRAPGEYTVTCTVTDWEDASATYQKAVIILNSPPAKGAGIISPRQAYVGEAIHFDVDATDPDGDRLSYRWDFGDGAFSSEKSPYHIYRSAGNYRVTVAVSDSYSNLTLIREIDIIEKEQFDAGLISNIINIICLLLIIIALIVFAARAIARRTAPQPGTPAPPYSGAPAPGPAPYQLTYSPPPQPKPRAAITACTRCGSTNLIGFPDGHVKCADCKKIMFNG